MAPSSQLDVAATVPQVLRDYALLADGERGILVGPRGDYAWMCFPGWADDGVFSSLIGGQGSYAITPTSRFVWGGYYEAGSLIWRSHWVTDDGTVIECREALALPSSPGQAVVLRRVLALRGNARVSVRLDPRGGFGATPVHGLSRDDAGCWHGRIGEIELGWTGGGGASVENHGRHGKLLRLELEVAEGEHHDFVLTLGSERVQPPDPDACWSATAAAWQARVPALELTVARRDARHAYAVLSGLTTSGGGMVAAATTSLPERQGRGRNYDYRYVWIRDQSYVGQAVAKTGPYPLMDDAVRFVSERLLTDGRDLKPAYTTSGGRVPDEQQLNLPGYPGGSDTIGNWVNSQFQLDGFGEALLLFAAAAAHDHLETDGWHAAETAVSAIEARWREPDAGIWEIDPDAWTHSRLICAAGLRAISAHHPGGEHAARWLALADQITADTSAHALHRSGRWQRSRGDQRLDVALLLPAIRGAIPADDPRSLATLHAVEAELTEDGYVYRFRHDARPLGKAEGAFLLCGFIMSLAHGQRGDVVAAARWFERTRAACGPPGLLAEEFDVEQRQLRGNLPQAFVHALLLECAADASSSGTGQ
ncbi:MAG: glycoside hydrolase family 15 protein [Actinobacteria bacterium]|nr:glycoside hydrolase family 15 protein [Actinomycetota bacterium]